MTTPPIGSRIASSHNDPREIAENNFHMFAPLWYEGRLIPLSWFCEIQYESWVNPENPLHCWLPQRLYWFPSLKLRMIPLRSHLLHAPVRKFSKHKTGNKMAIVRSLQIANAAANGAVAALLYSDPADYALEGYGPENTYPNTPWLPATGAQRGSVYKGSGGSGDPQTPGLPSLDGMYRRPLNDSLLPPIPAHPMSYGDAVNFLQAMGGE